VWRVTNLELQVDITKKVFDDFDASIAGHIKDGSFPVDSNKPDPAMWADFAELDEDFREEFFKVYGDTNTKDADDFSPEIMDGTYLIWNWLCRATVKSQRSHVLKRG